MLSQLKDQKSHLKHQKSQLKDQKSQFKSQFKSQLKDRKIVDFNQKSQHFLTFLLQSTIFDLFSIFFEIF